MHSEETRKNAGYDSCDSGYGCFPGERSATGRDSKPCCKRAHNKVNVLIKPRSGDMLLGAYANAERKPLDFASYLARPGRAGAGGRLMTLGSFHDS